MSESIKSDSTNSDSFELINNNDQNNDKILISPSLSSTSTENIDLTGNTTDNEEFRMEQEFKDKLDISNISSIVEGKLNDGDNLSSNSEISSIPTDKNDFDNQKLQQQLNMQIQSNQQHLQQLNSQANPQINKQLNQTNLQNLNTQNFEPQLLQQQLNAQKLNEFNQKLKQQDNQSNQQLNLQSNQQLNQTPQTNPPQTNPPQNQLPSNQQPVQAKPNEVVKLSPFSNFDPSSFLGSTLGWFSNNDIINQVKEKGVDTFNKVLITLDPQMKEIRLSGGPNILLISNQPLTNENIDSIRDGFLDVFKRATVKCIEIVSQIETAAQLVGFKTAVRINRERISALRLNISFVPQNQVIVSIENFLYNFEDRWFSSECITLDDPMLESNELSIHTQGTPISNKLIDQLKSKSTSYKFKEDGFNSRLDNLIATELNCSIGDVHKEYVGFDKSVLYHQAVVLLSNLYRRKLKELNRLNHE